MPGATPHEGAASSPESGASPSAPARLPSAELPAETSAAAEVSPEVSAAAEVSAEVSATPDGAAAAAGAASAAAPAVSSSSAPSLNPFPQSAPPLSAPSRASSAAQLVRLREEKAVAAEIFTQTVAQYESHLGVLEKRVRELEQQLVDLQKQVHQAPHAKSEERPVCSRLAPPDEAPFFVHPPSVDFDPEWTQVLGLQCGHEDTQQQAAIRVHKAQKLLRSRLVPPDLRHLLWLRALGNPLKITPAFYTLLRGQLTAVRAGVAAASRRYAQRIAEFFGFDELQAAKASSDAAAELPPSLVSSFEAIAVDLPRCLSYHTAPASQSGRSASPENNGLGNSDEGGSETGDHSGLRAGITAEERRTLELTSPGGQQRLLARVRELLEVFCVWRCDIGYTQGMDAMAVVLAVTEAKNEDPGLSFCLLANLALQQPQNSFLALRPNVLAAYAQAYRGMVNARVPQLLPLLETSAVPLDRFLYEWLLTAFARAVPLYLVPFLWDEIFLFGEQTMLKTAVAIVHHWRESEGGSLTERSLRQFSSEGLRDMSPEQSVRLLAWLRHQNRSGSSSGSKSVATRTSKALLKLIIHRERPEAAAAEDRTEAKSVVVTDERAETPAEQQAPHPPAKGRSKSFARLWRA